MIFYENYLLEDDAHEIDPFLMSKLKMLENLLSTAVVIGALRVNPYKPSVLIMGHTQTMQTKIRKV